VCATQSSYAGAEWPGTVASEPSGSAIILTTAGVGPKESFESFVHQVDVTCANFADCVRDGHEHVANSRAQANYVLSWRATDTLWKRPSKPGAGRPLLYSTYR
jgi:hypothetical protein